MNNHKEYAIAYKSAAWTEFGNTPWIEGGYDSPGDAERARKEKTALGIMTDAFVFEMPSEPMEQITWENVKKLRVPENVLQSEMATEGDNVARL